MNPKHIKIDGKLFQLVPVEPTEEMLTRAKNSVWIEAGEYAGSFNLTMDEAKAVHAAMLEASPTPPVAKPLTGEQIDDMGGVLDWNPV